jgi:hypothetical protein
MRTRALAAFVVLTSLFLPTPAAAHDATYVDEDDSHSRLDIEQVAMSESRTKVRFEITTFGRYNANQLKLTDERYFLIGFDQDRRASDRKPLERCVFIYHDGGLRWTATDCGDHLWGKGRASKPSARTLVVGLPFGKLDLYRDHMWGVLSSWRGSPCAGRCLDALPNGSEMILHDFTDPKVGLSVPLLASDASTSASFPVTLTVTDPQGSGIGEWTLWGRRIGWEGTYTSRATGTSGGTFTPIVDAVEGSVYNLYATATDAQGNWEESGYKDVIVPYDDDTVPARATTGATETEADENAYGGSVTLLTDTTATYGFQTGSVLCADTSWIIGDGSGSWTIEIVKIGFYGSEEVIATVNSAEVPDTPRTVLWQGIVCSTQMRVDVVDGGGVRIDAIGEE